MKFQDNHENKIEVKYRSNSENLFKTVKFYLISFFRPLIFISLFIFFIYFMFYVGIFLVFIFSLIFFYKKIKTLAR